MEKLDKETIRMIMLHVDKLSCPGHNKERFKQICIDDEYTKYLVSSYGRVFSLQKDMYKPKELKLQINSDTGYLMVRIYYNGKSKYILVHRLIATHFLKKKKNCDIINHKDGKKHNNCYWNLEWTTQKENVNHAIRMDLTNNFGENNMNNIYSEKQIRKVCKLLTNNISIPEIEKKTGVSRFEIHNVLKKHVWSQISDEYDFSDYCYGKDKKKVAKKIEKIHKACKMLESNKYTMREISDKTGLSYNDVKNIFRGGRYKDISSKYNISRFTNYIKYKTKKDNH